MNSWPNVLEGQTANAVSVLVPVSQYPLPTVVPLVKVSFREADLFRVALHPLRAPGLSPNPPNVVYSSQPAGGDSALLSEAVQGQPPAVNVYALVSWGTGSYRNSLIADWPREGCEFELSGSQVQIDGYVLNGPDSTNTYTFAASLSPGGVSRVSGSLGFSQSKVIGVAATRYFSVPSFARRVFVTRGTAVMGTAQSEQRNAAGDLLTRTLVQLGGGTWVDLVPGAVTLAVINSAVGATLEIFLGWEIEP